MYLVSESPSGAPWDHSTREQNVSGIRVTIRSSLGSQYSRGSRDPWHCMQATQEHRTQGSCRGYCPVSKPTSSSIMACSSSRLPRVRKVVALLARLGQPHLPPPLALLPHRRAHIVHAPLKQGLHRHMRRQLPWPKLTSLLVCLDTFCGLCSQPPLTLTLGHMPIKGRLHRRMHRNYPQTAHA